MRKPDRRSELVGKGSSLARRVAAVQMNVPFPRRFR